LKTALFIILRGKRAMISLLYFELKKIFSLKKTVICAAVVLSLSCVTFFGQAASENLFENLPEIKDILTYASGEVTPGRFAEDEKRFQEIVNSPEDHPASARESANGRYEGVFDGGVTYEKEVDMLESILFIKNVSVIPQTRISDLEKELQDPAIPYDRALLLRKNIAMLSQKGNLIIAYNLFYDYYNNFLINLFPYLIGFLIIFFIAPIFAGEYGTRMESLILSSKRGKRGVIAAKFFASLLAVTVIFTFVMGCYLLLCGAVLGFSGGESSFTTMNSDIFQYLISPYDFTMAQFLLTSLGISYAACIGFSLFTLLVSAKSRNILAVFSVCLLVFHVPLLISATSPHFPHIADLLYGRMTRVASLVDNFYGYVIFGKVVMLEDLSLAVLAATSMLFAFLAWRAFKRRQAVN
jgi:ABC-type transport system involved in multi-copper enzyme maturation permease subunit